TLRECTVEIVRATSLSYVFFCFPIRPPPSSTLFPYTTLFRSFPEIAGNGDEMGILRGIWANYRDKSFIGQYLSPRLMRHFLMFQDRKSTRLNSSHSQTSYAVFCLKKKKRHQAYSRRAGKCC